MADPNPTAQPSQAAARQAESVVESFKPTPEQIEAATAAGCSLSVSAAAGSGKTAVLAQRCAYLICDAPAAVRCDIDELLVLTFTDAAAAEMRTRIRDTLRQRRDQDPTNTRLRNQLQKVELAHISTIHAFCRWMVRQHFVQLDVDPNASMLDADEATLLLDESVQRVFAARQDSAAGPASAFRALVRHYGGGREETIAAHLTDIYRFVRTLHDGPVWLEAALEQARSNEHRIRELEQPALLAELDRQIVAISSAGEYIARHLPDWKTYAVQMDGLVESLRLWRTQLAGDATAYEAVTREMATLKLKIIAPRLPKDATEQQASEKDLAKRKWGQVRDWFKERLQRRYALFTTNEWCEGLQRLNPYLHTLIELLGEVEADYAAAKRHRHVLDFNDLEQMAYRLLAGRDGSPTAVARALQGKFAQVLVDEYQDINPIQDAILRLVSRETDSEAPNNLFCVGDIKQSIYRFRMADPRIFLSRLRRFDAPGSSDRTLPLSTNFRSSNNIISAINRIFERLMTPGLAGVEYDAKARLRFGRKEQADSPAVEVHWIEPSRSGKSDEGEADTELGEYVDIEKQAYLIGMRIRELVSAGEAQYHDIAILLRAATQRAEQVAGILQKMGIPTRADATTGFFEALEISDLLALLNVLDNMQQDIPLAAVMRSGVCGIRFDESDLLTLKQSGHDWDFHKCVAEFGDRQPVSELGARVAKLLEFLHRYRARVRRAPLPEVLNDIYGETNYLSYVAGLSGGPQRVANLRMLQRRAQQFSAFSGPQSLYGFLRFVERLRLRGDDLGPGNLVAQAAEAVRIMTIHNSKGLEFPVVFVANLEKRFNLADTRGAVTYDRDEFIGMPVADPERRIRYPSWLSVRVKDQVTRQSLAEELRILYVALTRAQDRLILVGSQSIEDVIHDRREWRDHAGPLPELQLLDAGSYTDWLRPVLASIADEEVQWIDDPDEALEARKFFHIHLHRVLDTSALPGSAGDGDVRLAQALAALEAVPNQAPIDPAIEAEIDAVFDRLDFVYPSLALGSVPSVLNVSDFKRRVNVFTEEDDLRRQPSTRFAKHAVPRFLDEGTALSPSHLGTAMHLFLQHLDYGGSERLAEQLADMVGRGWLTQAEAAKIDLDCVTWFLESELGRRAVRHAEQLRREVPFIYRIATDALDPQAKPTAPEDFIVLRGMVDLLIPVAGGYEVVDFKTDRLTGPQISQRGPIYREQIQQYATAMSRIWRCPIDRGAVVFLGPRVIEFVDFTQAT